MTLAFTQRDTITMRGDSNINIQGTGFFISRTNDFCLYRMPSLGETTAFLLFWEYGGLKEREEREHYCTFCNQNTGIEREMRVQSQNHFILNKHSFCHPSQLSFNLTSLCHLGEQLLFHFCIKIVASRCGFRTQT